MLAAGFKRYYVVHVARKFRNLIHYCFMLVDVQFDHKLIAQLFDLQPDAVVWYAPVFSEEDIVDFEYRYCNVAASRLLGVPVNEVTGTTLKNCPFLEQQTIDHILEQCITSDHRE